MQTTILGVEDESHSARHPLLSRIEASASADESKRLTAFDRAGNPVASFDYDFYYSVGGDRLEIHPQGVRVNRGLRRRGIASRLYDLAQQHEGVPIGEAEYRTRAGKAFRTAYDARP